MYKKDGIKFGFGISFIMNLNNNTIIKLALLFGVIIESMQFIISLYLGWTYRVIDINDVFFNFLGVIFGYTLFKLLSILFIKIIDNNNLKNDNFFN
ncbi:VanZ family protein [Peptostreptococcaceae bacterium AGR-M142]